MELSCTEQKLKSINALKSCQLLPHRRLFPVAYRMPGVPGACAGSASSSSLCFLGQSCLGDTCHSLPSGDGASCKKVNPVSSRVLPVVPVGRCCEPAHSGTHPWTRLWGWHPLTSWSRVPGERRRDERLSLTDVVGMVPIGCSQRSLGWEGLASTATIILTPVP